MVGANVEKSYISLKLKPKVTLFKAFQSMAIFPVFFPQHCILVITRMPLQCNEIFISSQIFRKEPNSRVSAIEIVVCLMGSFPFVQLKADIQRFGAVRRRFGYLLVLYLSYIYICKQHIIIARWEHKTRRSIVRSEPK